MKNKLSKRIFALFLSLLMVVTAFPIAVYAKSTEWTQVASTDFTKASFDKNADGTDKSATSSVNGDSTEKYITNGVTVKSGDNSMSWNAAVYKGTPELSGNGLYLSNGFAFLTGYSGASGTNYTPITGASSFKLDLGFRATTYDISASTRYGFLTLGTGTIYGHEKKVMNDSYYAFAQDGDGPAYVRGSSIYSENTNSYNISSNNGRLSPGTEYHYILSYSKNYLRGYITDANYGIVQTLFSYYTTSFDTSDIKSIQLGDDDTSYFYQGLTYTSIKFYTGVEQEKENAMKDTSREKYLFAYFTGQNNNDGEKIRLAVSDDGFNYEALNGNNSILINTPAAYYPSDGASKGKAASGSARDPFIIQKRNADGSIGKGYYVLATDLKVNGSDYTNSKMLVWYINDLTDLDSIQPWCLETTGWFGRDNATDFYAWAPEAVWDVEKNMYMILWSTGGEGGYNDLCLHYAYTHDFKTFYTKDNKEIGVNGVQPQKLINPYWGTDTGINMNIDGDIIYDGEFYWLFFKREKQQQIYYCHAESPSGPYSVPTKFTDSDYTDGCEGVEVFQLNDGTYVLMMDYYKSNGTFLMYTGTTLTGFEHNMVETSNINHLSPRHGAVTYITDDEYKALTNKYGKSTYDADGILDGTPVNDTLIARYFTTSDVTVDATGHGYSLTNAGTKATAEVKDGRTTAHFVSNSATSSSPDSGAYAYVNTSKMYSDYSLNAKDGITLDWYGNAATANAGRFFDISNAGIGELTWDTRWNKPYAYYTSNNEFGARGSLVQSYTNTANTWHHYTVTLTNNYMNVYVDGVLQKTVYSKGSVSKAGCPLSADISQWFFDTALGNGYLRFASSVFSGDAMLDGYISDFRVYSKALSQKEITNSIKQLSDKDNGVDIDGISPVFYDPMEDDAENGKTRYTATVTDELMSDVLNVVGGVQTHNPSSGYTAVASDTGYTVSMWYNPGDSNGNETIFNIGRPNSTDGSNRQYFELLEDGHLYYNWEVSGTSSYIGITDAFGEKSLTLNDWNHIVIQVAPESNHDVLNIFLNGQLVKTISTFNNSYGKSFVAGRSIHEYFEQNHDVYYGTGCGYWGTSSANAYIDSFAIYSGLYNGNSIYQNDSIAIASALLNKAVAEYEKKMGEIKNNPDSVYTNMLDAYEAYDRVVRYRDSIKYGGVESDPSHIVKLYNDLVNVALPNMVEYTKPTTTKQGMTPSEAGTTNSIDEKYTHNMLTPVSLSSKKEQDNGTMSDMNGAIYSGAFTWLYTGIENDTPTAPINGAIYTNRALSGIESIGQSGNFYSISVKDQTDKVAFGDDWYMTKNVPDNGVAYLYNDSVTTNMSSSYGATNKYRSFSDLSATKTWNYGSSYLKYTGTMGDTEYISTFTPNYQHHYYRKWIGDNTTETQQISGYEITVINFVPAKNALTDSSKMDVLAGITNYNPAAVKDLLEKYDALTSLDYTLSKSEDASNLAIKIEELVKALNGSTVPDPVKDAKADYTDAIKEVQEQQTFHDETITSGEYDNYTTSSWNAYDHAYNAIEKHFASLNPFDGSNLDSEGNDEGLGGDPYANDQDTVDRLKNNITKSKEVLVEKADYSSVESKVNEDNIVTNLATNNLTADNEQLYTYTTWSGFTNAYDTANGWATKSSKYKNDTEKYDVTYIRTDQTVQETENIYGPYIAFDKDGNVVTSDTQDIDHYEYIGVFYENDGDSEPSQFETGDYVLIDGKYIKLNYHRYYANEVNKPNESTRQTAIKNSAVDLGTKNDALTNVADYQNYDYSQQLAELADKDAYADNGAKIAENVATYGTSSAPASYNNAGGQPYITVGGVTYKDADQAQADAATTEVVTTLNTNKKTYTVTFNVYVDGVKTTQTYDKTYGDIVTLNAADVVPEVVNCTLSHTTLSNSDDKGSTVTSYINNNSAVLERRIQKDTNVDMYFVSVVEGAQLVKVQDYFGCPLDAGYVMPGETISVDKTAKTVSFTDAKGNAHNVLARESAFYTFNYFELFGAESDAAVTVADKDLLFTQRGTKSGNLTYIANGGTVNGAAELNDVKNSSQLEFVADDTTDFLVWVKTNADAPAVGDWHIASYQPTFKTFSADEGFVYQAVSNSNWSTYLTQAQYDKVMEKLPFSFGTAAKLINDNGVTKFRMYCDFAYDKSLSNVVIVEAGAIYSATANDEATLYKGGADCRTVAANSIDYDANSYTITKTNAGTGNHYMRSYVSFTYTTEVDGVETVIPRVVYGPVVKCENGSIVK